MLMVEHPYIVLCGIDGCGKTSISTSLQEYLQSEGIGSQILWSRFRNYLSKPLLAATRLSGHNYKFEKDGEVLSHHDFAGLPVYRELFAMLQAADVNIGAYWYLTRPRKKFRGVTIYERCPWDTLIDVVADTGMESLLRPLPSRIYAGQAMACEAVFFIHRDLEAIFESRPALKHDPTIRRRASIYRMMADRLGWVVIDNNGDLEVAKECIAEKTMCLLKERGITSVA